MPTYEITAPNGRKYRIDGPAGATDAQIRAQVLRQHPDAGKKAERSWLDQAGEVVSQQASSYVKGLAQIPDAVSNAYNGYQRVQNRAGGFIAENTLNALGRPQQASRVARETEQTDRRIYNQRLTTQRGADSLVAPPTTTAGKVANFGMEMVGAMASPFNALIAGAKPTQSETVARQAMTPVRTPPANPGRQVVEAGERNNVRVLTSDVRPPRTFLGKNTQSAAEKIPIAGTGGMRAAQQEQRIAAVKDFADEFGADDAAAIEGVAKDFLATRGKSLSTLTRMKTSVIEGTPGAVTPTRTLQAIDDQIAELTRRGTKPALDAAEYLKSIRPQMEGKTLFQLEAMRADELANAFKDGQTMAVINDVGVKAVRKIYDPLRQDMGEFIKGAAGPDAFRQWRIANAQLSGMAGELKVSALKSALKNAEATPESVGTMLFSAKPSQVRLLSKNLSPAGRSKAQAAIIHKALESADGAEGLSPDRFLGAVDKLGKPIGVMFEGADKARLEGLVRVLDATRRASAAAAHPPTGVQNTPTAIGYVIGTLFGWAGVPVAGGIGLLARAYESAPVRNALIGLARTQAGTPQEAVSMAKAVTALSAFAASKAGRALNDDMRLPLAAESPGEAKQQEQ